MRITTLLRRIGTAGSNRRGRPPKLRRVHGTPNPRADALVAAIENPTFPPDVEATITRIEAVRSRLANSDETLRWDRPWLADSTEMRERLKVDDGSDLTIEIDVAKAVRASRSPADCRLLLAVSRAVGPRSAIELGTNLGISGAYLATGLASGGRLHTLEGSEPKCVIAGEWLTELGLPVTVVPGDFFATLEPTLAAAAPLDLAFIDGFHEEQATLDFHAACKANAAPGAVFVFDDIFWSDGMENAWKALVADPDVACSLEYDGLGICCLQE